MPVFEYDHIDDFADVQEHDPANLALLCPNHHRDKTSGRLSRQAVAAARENPFNAGHAQSESYGLQATPSLRICLGSNCGSGPPEAIDYPVLWINGESLLTIHREDATYTYSARITDELGHSLLTISRGALTVATDVWDYRYEGRRVSIRRAAGEMLFDATIADQEFMIHRGALVDDYETGLLIKSDGRAAFTMSGLETCTISEGTFTNNAHCMIAIVRSSCYSGPTPPGGGFMRGWAAEFEERAADLRQRMEAGEPGNYPPGLEHFRPYPR